MKRATQVIWRARVCLSRLSGSGTGAAWSYESPGGRFRPSSSNFIITAQLRSDGTDRATWNSVLLYCEIITSINSVSLSLFSVPYPWKHAIPKQMGRFTYYFFTVDSQKKGYDRVKKKKSVQQVRKTDKISWTNFMSKRNHSPRNHYM